MTITKLKATSASAVFPLPDGAFIIGVDKRPSDYGSRGYIYETPVSDFKTPAEVLKANDDFEDCDAIYLINPARGTCTDITEIMALAWLKKNDDMTREDIDRIGMTPDGRHGQHMRWLLESDAFEDWSSNLLQSEADDALYGSYAQQHRFRACDLV